MKEHIDARAIEQLDEENDTLGISIYYDPKAKMFMSTLYRTTFKI